MSIFGADQTKNRTPIQNYRNILKASSISGGSQVVTLIIGIGRTKLAAIFLGSAGIGLLGLYQNLLNLIDGITNLGIASSGVREIGAARGAGDPSRSDAVGLVMRRAAWILGGSGCLLAGVFAGPLSRWTFQSPDHAPEVAALGGISLLMALTTARTALMQGHQRIREIAISGICTSLASACVAVLLFWHFGERGILPSLFATSLFGAVFAFYFSRGLSSRGVKVDWPSFWTDFRRLAALGLSFMIGGVLMIAVSLITRALILRDFGMEANGLYQAAYALSGLFVGFVLNAMSVDFFPRLSSISSDNPAVTRLVNEQIEVGVLLSLPGMIATIAFAPQILRLFYTPEFAPASTLLSGLFIGCFAQVVGWPLGFVARAKGEARWVVLTECALIALHLGAILLLLPKFGLIGIAAAFTIFYLCYILVMWRVARHLSGFRWSRGALRIVGFSLVLILLTFLPNRLLTEVPALLIGVGFSAAAALFSARGIALRLGPDHLVVRLLSRLPGWSLLHGPQVPRP